MRHANCTHGMYGTPIYNVWNSMRSRCRNPNSQAYENYGGRGITLCKRWHKFENFYADMGDQPEGLTLDRIKNDQGYNKSNCRWATMSEQAHNRRSNVRLKFNGVTHDITEWAAKLGIPRNLIYDRIRAGWTPEKALTMPKRGQPKGVQAK